MADGPNLRVMNSPHSIDVFHIVNADTMQTLCGLSAAEWYSLPDTPEEAAESAYCCRKCVKAYWLLTAETKS